MDTQIIAIFCLCDDMLKALHHFEDPQCQMTDAEVMTTAILAAMRFHGNFELARHFLEEEAYIPHMLGKSRFIRRLHRIQDLFMTLFRLLGETWKDLNSQSIYVLDSYPIAACDNYRIIRSRRYHGEVWRGHQASKKRYFYGVKIHIMVTEHGQPVEFFLTPGSISDTSAYRQYDFDLPSQAWITADKAYTDYDVEDAINESGLRMKPMRKSNSKRPFPPWIFYLQSTYRKIVETTGSMIERLLPKSIHSVTPQGFELKVGLFVLAASLNFLW
jgi:Transposase DDE domain